MPSRRNHDSRWAVTRACTLYSSVTLVLVVLILSWLLDELFPAHRSQSGAKIGAELQKSIESLCTGAVIKREVLNIG